MPYTNLYEAPLLPENPTELPAEGLVVEEMDPRSELQFASASDLKNWIDQEILEGKDRREVENKLMELVKDDDQEFVTSAMEDYFESLLTEEEKLEIAISIWPKLPDIIRMDKTNVQERTMDLPLTHAHDIDNIIKESNSEIKSLASRDAKKSKVVNAFNLIKTAQHKSMENVILYGPGQMQSVDPFTRQPASEWSIIERNKGFGLVVDDLWNINWEAIWRGSIMDKYSRPYRDKDGNWVGGYVQKRFEVDKWTPEKNNYQLKPGQRRRPYVPEQRSLEARMVAQRSSDDSPYESADKTKPFNWKMASTKKKR